MQLKQPPLLPFEKALAQELGVTPETYQRFKAEVAKNTKLEPSTIVAGPAVLPFLINLVIGVGFSLLGSLFKPKGRKPPQLTNKQDVGDTINQNQRRAPRYGFDSSQDVTTVGSYCPVVIARRETLDGVSYGGIRANLDLVWSQMWSIRGNQIFRGIYLLGRGPMGFVDPVGFALGNNTLVPYELAGDTFESARYSLYYSSNGGRLVSGDQIGGRKASADPANLQNNGGQDVFSHYGIDNTIARDFSVTARPTSGTTFGVYGHCPNGMGYRVAPRVRPTCNCALQTRAGGSYFIECEDDTSALADFWLSKYIWSSRSGIRGYRRGGSTFTPATGNQMTEVNVLVGDVLIYQLNKSTDSNTIIKFDDNNTDNDTPDSETELECTTVGSAVAGWQRAADDQLVEGSVFKCGSALAILAQRDSDGPDDWFTSEADNEPVGNGSTMEYELRVIRAGRVGFVGPDILNPPTSGTTLEPPFYDREDDMALLTVTDRYETASSFPQVMRVALASFGTTQPTRLVEIGFKSSVGISVNGFTNFRDCPKLVDINAKAGQNRSGAATSTSRINTSTFQSGTITKDEMRYSCGLLEYRDGPGEWQSFNAAAFAWRSSSNSPIYTYIRVQLPYISSSWQFRIEPLSAWEIRTQTGWNGDLIVLDPSSATGSRTDEAQNVSIFYNGYHLEEAQWDNAFRLTTIDTAVDVGYGFIEEDSMIDTYARLAERLPYNEIVPSCANGPEHEITYVNAITPNAQLATYSDLALIGLNIQAGPEISQLSQASQDVSSGYEMRSLLQNDVITSSHLLPDWIREKLTNKALGEGMYINDIQIDRASFQVAAQWCLDRRYFYDAIEERPLNTLTWLSQVLPTHLLQFTKRGSKFSLRPALVFGLPVPISGLFTAGNIAEDSFEMTLIPYSERQPIQALGIYREQSPALSSFEPGNFPQNRTILVRETARPTTDPLETFDLSDYCTSERHLIDALAHMIRRRRLVDHTISFKTTTEGLTSGLASGDYIQVAYDLIEFDTYAHGVITNEGQLVTTRPDLLPPGVHDCLTWDGSDSEPVQQLVTVNTFGTASPSGIMFAKRTVDTQLRTYEITRIGIDQEGYITIEASYHPCDAAGFSLLAQNWPIYSSDQNWTITR
jgi:hypothetical protein